MTSIGPQGGCPRRGGKRVPELVGRRGQPGRSLRRAGCSRPHRSGQRHRPLDLRPGIGMGRASRRRHDGVGLMVHGSPAETRAWDSRCHRHRPVGSAQARHGDHGRGGDHGHPDQRALLGGRDRCSRIRPNGAPFMAYPSGHTPGTIVQNGFAIHLAHRLGLNRRLFVSLVVLLALPMILVGPARIVVGVHWSTDVLGTYPSGRER